MANGDKKRRRSHTRTRSEQLQDLEIKVKVMKEELDERLHQIESLQTIAIESVPAEEQEAFMERVSTWQQSEFPTCLNGVPR